MRIFDWEYKKPVVETKKRKNIFTNFVIIKKIRAIPGTALLTINFSFS